MVSFLTELVFNKLFEKNFFDFSASLLMVIYMNHYWCQRGFFQELFQCTWTCVGDRSSAVTGSRVSLFSLLVNLCNWILLWLLPKQIPMSTPIYWSIYLNICMKCIILLVRFLRLSLASLLHLVDSYMQFRHLLKACLFCQGCGTWKILFSLILVPDRRSGSNNRAKSHTYVWSIGRIPYILWKPEVAIHSDWSIFFRCPSLGTDSTLY